ncbi:MAG: response regulator transcription factor [Myxococcota bacterium]|nr:response regulator transcription factor [Myxococcota bacterium]
MSFVLLIDDEVAITESLAFAIHRAGLATRSAHTLADARQILAESEPLLIVLDIILPDGNGLDWLRALRAQMAVPVIILSSHDETIDRIIGLEIGADDYVVKPFSPREVTARIRAVLRRHQPGQLNEPTRMAGALKIDRTRHRAWAQQTELQLSRIEFELLSLLVESPGKVFDREMILNRVWGPNVAVTERTIDVHIKTLRKKLVQAGVSAETIETVRGVGYRLAEQALQL